MDNSWTKTIDRQIKKRKWSWIGHTLHKPSGITEKDALDWNPQGKRGRPKKTWKHTVEGEARGQGKGGRKCKLRLRLSEMEKPHQGPMLHIGVKGNDDDDDGDG
jgi:hypothetical protein